MCAAVAKFPLVPCLVLHSFLSCICGSVYMYMMARAAANRLYIYITLTHTRDSSSNQPSMNGSTPVEWSVSQSDLPLLLLLIVLWVSIISSSFCLNDVEIAFSLPVEVDSAQFDFWISFGEIVLFVEPASLNSGKKSHIFLLFVKTLLKTKLFDYSNLPIGNIRKTVKFTSIHWLRTMKGFKNTR